MLSQNSLDRFSEAGRFLMGSFSATGSLARAPPRSALVVAEPTDPSISRAIGRIVARHGVEKRVL